VIAAHLLSHYFYHYRDQGGKGKGGIIFLGGKSPASSFSSPARKKGVLLFMIQRIEKGEEYDSA